jgi:hypothetical protein
MTLGLVGSHTAAPPHTELQRQLLRVWQDALNVDAIGVEDNFFDAGGNSFALATVHARLSELLGRRLPLVSLYEYPTIAALAAHLSDPCPTAAKAIGDPASERLRAGRARLAERRLRQR